MTNYATYNPHNRPIDELPVIYGFNNGGSPGWYHGALIAEDGEVLGGHVCSHEGFMLGDLGIVEGSRLDRHKHFRAHYPDGYRMDFVPESEVMSHPGLGAACEKNAARAAVAEPSVSEEG